MLPVREYIEEFITDDVFDVKAMALDIYDALDLDYDGPSKPRKFPIEQMEGNYNLLVARLYFEAEDFSDLTEVKYIDIKIFNMDTMAVTIDGETETFDDADEMIDYVEDIYWQYQ